MIARRFQGRGEAQDDLQQVALLGLLKAIDRFDPERGVRFSTFAVPTIVGELKRHFRDKGWMVRVPRSVQELRSEIKIAISHLTQELGRSPKVHEIANRVGCHAEQVLEALDARTAYRSDSLDAPGSIDDAAVIDGLGASDREIETVVDRIEVQDLLAALPPRERRILVLRFFGSLTQSEIARHVGVSQMHVSRLITETLARLREQLGADNDEVVSPQHDPARGLA